MCARVSNIDILQSQYLTAVAGPVVLTDESCSLTFPSLPGVVNADLLLLTSIARSNSAMPRVFQNQREPCQRPFAPRDPEHAQPLRVREDLFESSLESL